MFKYFSISFFFIFISIHISAQSTGISGKIVDTTAKANVKHAVVAVLSLQDSVLLKFTRTNDKGDFYLSDIQDGQYILMIMHPVFADYVEQINVIEESKKIGNISMTPKSKLLEAVILKSGSPIRIKGDTTIYTADSFKVSANANVEELLKKLPGIQVDRNGQIKAMGQTVEKVLVDGEEFFGNDPGMAVKNLRADAVKEVQVFDKKSEQAEFTGIEDGNTQKTINLKLKENSKTGYFGKVSVSGGLRNDMDDRYNNNLMFSTFKGKRKISAFILNGNTGQDGLSWQDNEKFGGESDEYSMSVSDDGGMMFSYRGGGTDDEPDVNTENGFIANINAGLHYSNKWNDKHSINFSPKFNSQKYTNTKSSFIQRQVNDSLFNEHTVEQTLVNRKNYKFRGSYDVKLDTMNTLKLTAGANFYTTESELVADAETTGDLNRLINESNTQSSFKSDKQAFYTNLLFKHKFRKSRRTFSATADWKLLTSDARSFLNTFNKTYKNGLPTFSLNQDQMKDNEKATQSISSKIIYTEPLSKKLSLEIGYELSYTKGKNDQLTFSYSPISGKYDVKVDSLTNDFDQTVTINKPSLKLNFANKKLKVNIGSGIGITHFNLHDNTLNKDYIRDFTNFFPGASLSYSYKSNHNLRFNYNGSTTQPTINQLQPINNNNDYFNQYIGNPDLKQSFRNQFNLSHNSYDFLKDRWMYQSLNIIQTGNAITNNRVINTTTGQTILQPINTNGNYSINLWSGFGFKNKKLDTRININPNFNYTRFADIINNATSFSKTLSAGLGINLSKSKDKKYDISIGNDFSFNNNSNAQSRTNINYFVNTVSANMTVHLTQSWSVISDYQYYIRQKTEQFSNNLNNQLLNAKIQKTFRKNEFTAFFQVRDILNQNIGVERSFYGNTLSEERNERLKRFWMIGFAWDFKNKSAKTN